MKLIALLIILFAVIPVNAQEIDFEDYYTQLPNGEFYRRSEAVVKVCPTVEVGIEYTEEWREVFELAAEQMSRAVPSEAGELSTINCAIYVTLVDELPKQCNVGGTALACAGQFDPILPSHILILYNTPGKLPVLLHELMHAYGITQHPPVWNSIVYYEAHLSFTELTDWDIAALEYLYRQ